LSDIAQGTVSPMTDKGSGISGNDADARDLTDLESAEKREVQEYKLPAPSDSQKNTETLKNIIVKQQDELNLSTVSGIKADSKSISNDRSNLKGNSVKDSEKDIVERPFTVVEQMPEFPGGEEKMLRFLMENIKYPETARENGISGSVYVTFVVGKNGVISDVKLLRGIGGGCDEEAIRVIKMMPHWVPGRQNGKSVAVLFNLPVNFKLTEK
jgi:periplasmic protein TonB